MNCPICRKEVPPGGPYEPFCSDRCRLVDLGNWATGQYRIRGPAKNETEPDEEADERGE